MSTKKFYFGMIGLVGLLSVASIALLVLGNMFLEKQAHKLNDLKVQDQVLEEQQTALKQAKKDLAKNADLEKTAKAVVPQDKDQAQAVLEIVNIAKASNINIASITFPSSTLGAAAAPQASNSTSTPGDSSSSSAGSTPSTKAPPITQAKPVDGINGVYSLEIKVTPDATPITYYQFLDFLSRLENNRRTAQVTQVNVTPVGTDRTNPLITFTLTLNIFVKPS